MPEGQRTTLVGRSQDLILPVAIIASVLVIMVPLPAALMDVLLAGNITIAARGEYRGTYRATGRSTTAAFAHVYRLRGGRIVRFEQFTDTLKVAEAMGTRATGP